MGSYIILYISTLVPVWELATCCDVTEGTDWCGWVPVVREFLHMQRHDKTNKLRNQLSAEMHDPLFMACRFNIRLKHTHTHTHIHAHAYTHGLQRWDNVPYDGHRAVWSESSLSAEDTLYPKLPTVCLSKTDRTTRVRRLIWVFAKRTCNLVGNAVPRFNFVFPFSWLTQTRKRSNQDLCCIYKQRAAWPAKTQIKRWIRTILSATSLNWPVFSLGANVRRYSFQVASHFCWFILRF